MITESVRLPSGIRDRLKRASGCTIDRAGVPVTAINFDGSLIPRNMIDEYLSMNFRNLNYEQKCLLRDHLLKIVRQAEREERQCI